MGIATVRARLTRLVTLLALCCSAVVSSAFDGFTFQDVEGPDDLSPAMRHTEHEVSPAMLEVEEGAPTYPRVNQHAPGEPMAFECGRFDMGHHCSSEADAEMEVAEQCGEHDDQGKLLKSTFIGCCRQVRINFLNQNFKRTPVVVVSVLRPRHLLSAAYSPFACSPSLVGGGGSCPRLLERARRRRPREVNSGQRKTTTNVVCVVGQRG